MNPNAQAAHGPAFSTLLTTAEVAEMLHLHANTVKRLGDRGDLPFFRVSARGDRRYRLEDVQGFLGLVRSAA